METSTVLNYIYDLVNAVSSIKETFKRRKSVTEGYPIAIISEGAREEIFLDTARNKETVQFQIDIWQETEHKTGFGMQKAERVLRNVVDDVVAVLRADDTLGGNVDYAEPPDVSDPSVEDAQEGKMINVRIIINCIKTSNR